MESIEQLGTWLSQRLVDPSRVDGFRHALRHFRDPQLRLFAFGIGLLVYASELASFTLSIDEEAHTFASASQIADAWLSQGRWAMAALSYIFPPFATVPFVPTAIFCVCLATSALLLAGCFVRSRAEAFAFVGLFVSCPIWLHIGEFNTVSWGFGIGLCLASLAVALLHVGGLRGAIVAAALTGVATGIYQGLLLSVVCGGLLSLATTIGGMRRAEFSWSKLGPLVGTMVASWIVAAIINYDSSAFALYVSGQKPFYVESYLRIDDFLSAEKSAGAIHRTFERVDQLLFGGDPTFLGWGSASMLLAWVGAAIALIQLLRDSDVSPFAKLAALLFAFGSIVAALSLVLASAGDIPTRALTALPLLYAAAGAYMMGVVWAGQLTHWFAFCVALLVNSWIAATLFSADAIARDRDRLIATILADRIANVPGVKPDQPFVIVGQWNHEIAGPAARVEVFGASFFEHDGGNPHRVGHYLELLGVKGLRPTPITEMRDQLADIEKLPSWPAPGSVALIADKLIIKFGPLSFQQKLALSAPERNK